MADCVKDPVDVLLAEVERRKKLPGLHNYSYGRLIADTTEEERRRMVEAAGVKKDKPKPDPGKKEIVCQYCGKREILTTRSGMNRKYCSVDCQLAARRLRSKNHMRGGDFVERTCKKCGEVLSDSRYRLCRLCRIEKESEAENAALSQKTAVTEKAAVAEKAAAKNKAETVCKYCGKTFEKCRGSRKEFCSPQCRFRMKYQPEQIRSRDEQGRRICLWCGTLLAKGKKKNCCEKCAVKGHNRYIMGIRLGVLVDG